MHRMRRSVLLESLKAFDTLAVASAAGLGLFVTATEARHSSLGEFLALRVHLGNGLLALAFLATCRRIFSCCGLYRSHRLEVRRQLYEQIAKAVSAATAVLAASGALFRVEALDWSCLPVFWASALGSVAGSRVLLYRWLEALRRRGEMQCQTLVVGAGPRGRWLAAELESRPEWGCRVIGFLDDSESVVAPGSRWLGGIEELSRLLRHEHVDEVVVALPLKTFYPDVSRIVSVCEEHGVVVRVPGNLFPARLARVESEQIEELSMLTLVTGRGSASSLAAKRAADIAMAAAGLIVLAPVLAAIATAIRLDSPGPALFGQVRVGYNRRRFRMWKFRTMAVDAETRQAELEACNEADGAAFKIRNDPRVTRLGRWLRRASLDELPQLVNVLKGQMSLVGPRPLPLRDVERLSQSWQRRRFSVRPGLTCLWQAGGRHRIGFEQWMRLDLDYIDNWSLWLDVKILLRTVPALLSGAGAS